MTHQDVLQRKADLVKAKQDFKNAFDADVDLDTLKMYSTILRRAKLRLAYAKQEYAKNKKKSSPARLRRTV